jgi:hypothetical protein
MICGNIGRRRRIRWGRIWEKLFNKFYSEELKKALQTTYKDKLQNVRLLLQVQPLDWDPINF